MAEEKKKKKPRKQRKDKGTRRKPTYIGAFREKEGRPTTKMEVLASGGLTGAKLGNATRLAGILGSMRQPAPPQVDYSAMIKEEFQKQQKQFDEYFNKQSVAIVPKADVAQAQEEQSQQESPEKSIVRDVKKAMGATIQRIEKEKKELFSKVTGAEEREQQAVERAQEAESELRQIQPILAEQVQLLEETIMKNREEEYKAVQYNKKARYEEIMRKTKDVKDAKKYLDYDGDKEGLNDFRKQLFDEEGIKVKRPEKTGQRGAPSFKWEFDESLPDEMGGGYFSQLEQERGQLEDQIGGLHDELRQAQLREAHLKDTYDAKQFLRDVVGRTRLELQTKGYERKVQEAKASEAEAFQIALSKQEELAQREQEYQQLLGEAEESYEGLRGQMEREGLTAQEQRMGLEAEIRRLKEERDAEVAQGLAIKNAETARLEENIRTLQRGNEDLQAQTKRLQDEIDFKKQLMEGAVTKKEADELRKEIRQLKKDLEYAKDQGKKGDLAIIRYQKEKAEYQQEKADLQNALVLSKALQKDTEQEQQSAVASVRQAMGARIENMRTREERQVEQMTQMEEEFNEERQALQAQIIELRGERDLIAQKALQAEEEYNTEAEWSNAEFEKLQRELAREGLMSIFFENELKRSNQVAQKQEEQLLQTIREATLAEEQARMREEKSLSIQTGLAEAPIAEFKAQPRLAPLLAPLQIPSSIPTNPIPPEQRVASPPSRIMAGSASPKIIPPKEETGPAVRPKKVVKVKEKAEEPQGISMALADMSDEQLAERIRERRNSTIPSEIEKVQKYRNEIRRREQRAELREQGILSFDEMSRDQQLRKLQEYKERMKKNPEDITTAQKMMSLESVIRRQNVQMMQPKTKEELRQKTGVAFETPIEQEAPEAKAVRERVRQRIAMSQNPLQQDILQGQEEVPATIIGNTLLNEFQQGPTSL